MTTSDPYPQVMRLLRAQHLGKFSYRSQLYLLLAPYALGLGVLVLAPMLITLALAFTDYDIFSPPRWNDFANLIHFLTDQLLHRALYNSLWFVLIGVTLRGSAALLLALLLNRSGRAVALARVTIYLPTIMPEVAYALVWILIMTPGFGPFSLALRALNLPTEPWLQVPFTARATIVVMWVLQLGEGFVLMLAALQTIPRETLESAAIDGANRLQIFRRILLPLLVPALLLLAMRDTALSFQGSFVPGLLTTQTGPYYTTYFLPHYIFDESFGLFKYGYGSAVTTIVYVISGLLITMQYLVARRWSRPEEI